MFRGSAPLSTRCWGEGKSGGEVYYLHTLLCKLLGRMLDSMALWCDPTRLSLIKVYIIYAMVTFLDHFGILFDAVDPWEGGAEIRACAECRSLPSLLIDFLLMFSCPSFYTLPAVRQWADPQRGQWCRYWGSRGQRQRLGPAARAFRCKKQNPQRSTEERQHTRGRPQTSKPPLGIRIPLSHPVILSLLQPCEGSSDWPNWIRV